MAHFTNKTALIAGASRGMGRARNSWSLVRDCLSVGKSNLGPCLRTAGNKRYSIRPPTRLQDIALALQHGRLAPLFEHASCRDSVKRGFQMAKLQGKVAVITGGSSGQG